MLKQLQNPIKNVRNLYELLLEENVKKNQRNQRQKMNRNSHIWMRDENLYEALDICLCVGKFGIEYYKDITSLIKMRCGYPLLLFIVYLNVFAISFWRSAP